jgi:hypothetical protein
MPLALPQSDGKNVMCLLNKVSILEREGKGFGN